MINDNNNNDYTYIYIYTWAIYIYDSSMFCEYDGNGRLVVPVNHGYNIGKYMSDMITKAVAAHNGKWWFAIMSVRVTLISAPTSKSLLGLEPMVSDVYSYVLWLLDSTSLHL